MKVFSIDLNYLGMVFAFSGIIVLVATLARGTAEPATVTDVPGCLQGKSIVLDPGHGGKDSGIQRQGVLEKDINLAIVLKTAALLRLQGVNIVLTREKDEGFYDFGPGGKRGDLEKRVQVTKNSNADLFISIHVNGARGDKWAGAQVFYNPQAPVNKEVADCIQKVFAEFQQGNKRQAKSEHEIIVLKEAPIPAVLVEVGFLTNGKERELLQTDQYQQQVAEVLVKGIQAYYGGIAKPTV